jgi:predicted nucleotidyltransferase
MRVNNREISIIKSTLLENISDAKILLFGSRSDDSKKGGDIDLLVETQKHISLKEELKILALMELRGIERKIDLIIESRNSTKKNIYTTAHLTGVIL